MKRHLATVNRYLFVTALPVNFFCILNYSSNTLPLTLLAVCFLLSFFEDGRPRFSWYHAVFAAFIAYLAVHSLVVFPEEKIFSFSRKAVMAFLAGGAAFHFFKEKKMRFMYLMNLIFPFAIVWLVVLLALGQIQVDALFNASSRLILRTNHPTTLGMMLCISLITGLHFLFSEPPDASAFPLAGGGRLPRMLYKAVRSKALVSAGMLLCAVLLFPTLSKTALLTTGAVCGSFLAYKVYKHLGFVRGAALGLVLALCAVGAWELAPVSREHKGRFYENVLKNAATPWNYPTFVSRKPIWESGFAATREHPLFGIGMNSFCAYHQNRVRQEYDRLVAAYGRDLVDTDTIRITSPHNTYLLWFAETGLIGGSLFCLLFFTPLGYCLRQRTLYGELGLILSAYLIDFFFDDLMSGGRASSFCVTVVFMTFGYFGSILADKGREGARPVFPHT